MSRIVTWESGMPSLPRSVVAIGVFDGVHLGHQALLAETVTDAAERGAASVAITFDRDPDQVVTPEVAAPQLLTLPDKLGFMVECGIDTVLVVPFTPSIAALQPTAFLDLVVAPALDVVAIHVGADFRFGTRASGTVGTLQEWAAGRGITVTGQPLVVAEGDAITSTRIRALVAAGDVGAAARLLGRPHRVSATVAKGRQTGRDLGFPTANLHPSTYAALPARGVYAGRALLAHGESWPAAISVGAPPSFPEAHDYLEVHLIGFEGDLYGATMTVEFLAKLRDQQRFDDLDELSAAIALDVEHAATIAESSDMASAEAPASTGHTVPAQPEYDNPHDAGWVQVAETRATGPMAALQGTFGRPAILLAIPLEAANIPYRWEPFSPESASVGTALFPRPFTLLVPAEFADQARDLLAADAADAAAGSMSLATAGESLGEQGQDIADEDVVEDEAALAEAQSAVNEASSPGMFATVDASVAEAGRADVDPLAWTYLAEGFAPGPIEMLSEALGDAKIDTLWDPFPPEKRAAFWGRTNLTVFVPLIELGEAQRLAEETGILERSADNDIP